MIFASWMCCGVYTLGTFIAAASACTSKRVNEGAWIAVFVIGTIFSILCILIHIIGKNGKMQPSISKAFSMCMWFHFALHTSMLVVVSWFTSRTSERFASMLSVYVATYPILVLPNGFIICKMIIGQSVTEENK